MSAVTRELIASLKARHEGEMSVLGAAAEAEFDGSQLSCLLTEADLDKWAEQDKSTRNEFLDAIALELALGFNENALDFDFCDRVVNDLLGALNLYEGEPALFWSVFLAFDAGEYYHDEDRSVHPVDRYTRPQIAEIIRRGTAS